jgi:hypothetical protein
MTNKEPTTVNDVFNVVKVNMKIEDFNASVLEVADGIVVVNTDGEKVTEIHKFSNMDEVNQYEENAQAKADTASNAEKLKLENFRTSFPEELK